MSNYLSDRYKYAVRSAGQTTFYFLSPQSLRLLFPSLPNILNFQPGTLKLSCSHQSKTMNFNDHFQTFNASGYRHLYIVVKLQENEFEEICGDEKAMFDHAARKMFAENIELKEKVAMLSSSLCKAEKRIQEDECKLETEKLKIRVLEEEVFDKTVSLNSFQIHYKRLKEESVSLREALKKKSAWAAVEKPKENYPQKNINFMNPGSVRKTPSCSVESAAFGGKLDEVEKDPGKLSKFPSCFGTWPDPTTNEKKQSLQQQSANRKERARIAVLTKVRRKLKLRGKEDHDLKALSWLQLGSESKKLTDASESPTSSVENQIEADSRGRRTTRDAFDNRMVAAKETTPTGGLG